MARTGRPRNFDRDRAVEQAMLLFWDHGYEATSLSQLRTAMGGISSASFYAAFESKEELYREVVRRYANTYGQVTAPLHDKAMAPRDAVETTLRGSAIMQTDTTHPAGCLIVLSTSTSAPGNRELKQVTISEREHSRRGFEACVKRAIANGELARDTPVAALATLFDGCLLGLSIQARDGVPLAKLQDAITQVMKVWDDYRVEPEQTRHRPAANPRSRKS